MSTTLHPNKSDRGFFAFVGAFVSSMTQVRSIKGWFRVCGNSAGF